MRKLELVLFYLLPFVVVGTMAWVLNDRSRRVEELSARYNEMQAAWYNCLEGQPMRAYYTKDIWVEFYCATQRPVGGIGRHKLP